jgi:polyisoprenoid-binding protein YceI
MKRTILTAAVALMSFAAGAATWTADKAHSRLGFNITHLMVSEVDGSFRSFTATIKSDKPDFSDAVFELSAEVASINTDNDKRDEHLRTADYFDVAKYPAITFKSTSVKKGSGKNYTITGNLTMHGVTKAVKLSGVLVGQGTHPYTKKPIVGFKFTGSVKRLEFGIGKDSGTAALGDEVEIVATGEFAQD